MPKTNEIIGKLDPRQEQCFMCHTYKDWSYMHQRGPWICLECYRKNPFVIPILTNRYNLNAL